MFFSSIRKSWYSRSINLCLMVTFVTSMVITPKASYAGVLGLPQPGTMVNLSPAYVPLMISGLTVHPENPLLMDFIVSTGNSGLNTDQVRKESNRLIKYFLACLTIPENDQWVNLSPYEKQRIVPEDLGKTVLGQDLLAQDYLLKQLTASLIYPEKNLGKSFWDKVYSQAQQQFGSTNIPVNTFNKVWILPDTAQVYVHNNTVFVVKSHLKVMLDEDYLSLSKHADINGTQEVKTQVNSLGAQIVRQIVLPAIEEEVNQGQNFAQLRQIYNSMILAFWFKNNLKEALLNQVYTDKAKVNGVNVSDPAIKEKIYRQYLQAYKKGVFNYIKQDIDQSTQQVIPRKYFSGGTTPVRNVRVVGYQELQGALTGEPVGNNFIDVKGVDENASNPGNPSAAMITAKDEYTKPINTVSHDDFQDLVEARQRGEMGVPHNVERRSMIPPSTDTISRIVLQWSNLPEAERVRLVAREAGMFRQGQVAEIVMAGGEATRYGGPKAFKEVTPELGSFLGIKADNLRWFNENFGIHVPLFLLSSETRIESFKQQLADHDYYGLQDNLFKWYVQGSVDTFIPTDEEIDTLSATAELKGKYKQAAAKLREENPDGIYRFLGNRRPVVPGHLDAVSAFIVSGRLAEALKMGIRYSPVFNIDNLQAILKNQGLFAHFAESGADFGFILAEKNLTFSFKDKTGKYTIPKVFVRFRENALSFDDIKVFQGQAEKDGFRYVIDQTDKTVNVFNIESGEKIDVDTDIKPETGGTLVEYEDTGEAIMKEGFELPKGFPHAQAPFFNTNTIIIRLMSLLRILGLSENEEGIKQLEEMTFEQRSELVRSKIVKQVKANFEMKKHVVEGQFSEYGDVDAGKNETSINVSQVTRIMLQVAHIPGVKVQYYFMPREEVFAPVKTPDDAIPAAENSKSSLDLYTLKAGESLSWQFVHESSADENGVKTRFFAFKRGEADHRRVIMQLVNGHVHLTVDDVELNGTYPVAMFNFTPKQLMEALDMAMATDENLRFRQSNARIGEIVVQNPDKDLKVYFNGDLLVDLKSKDNNKLAAIGKALMNKVDVVGVFSLETTDNNNLIEIKISSNAAMIGDETVDFTRFREIAASNREIESGVTKIDIQLTADTANELRESSPSFLVAIMPDKNNVLRNATYESIGTDGRLFYYKKVPFVTSPWMPADSIKSITIHRGVVRNLKRIFQNLISRNDKAQISPEGGIDLNSRNLKMDSEGEKINITFNPAMIAQFKRGDFSGVRFRILDVIPINLMPLLGLKEDEGSMQVVKA